MRYRPEIDGLRALAVLPVVLFHAGVSWFAGGYVGVDVFFVISGYLITGIIAEEQKTSSFTIRGFYERRVRRILPALAVVTLSCVPAAWVWLSPGDFRDFSQSLVGVYTFSSNILFWLEAGYFDAAGELKPLLHTWSLSLEEQFYVVFPLAMLATRQWSTRARMWLFGLVALVSLAGAEYAIYQSPSAAFYLLPYRAWELLAGALLALLTTQPHDSLSPRWGGMLSATGLALVLWSIFSYGNATRFPGFHAVAPVAGTCLLLLFATPQNSIGRALAHPALVRVGLLSYSLYLWHQPLFAFARHKSLLPPSVATLLLLACVALGLAYATWRLIETPARSRSRLPLRSLLGVGSVVVVAQLAIGMVGVTFDGSTLRGAVFDRATVAQRQQTPDRTCAFEEFRLSSDCTTGDGAPEVLLWGDSYARHLIPALREAFPGRSMAFVTMSGCPPVLGLAPIGKEISVQEAWRCLSFNDAAIDWLRRSSTVRYVVISSPFDLLLSPDWRLLTDSGEVLPDIETARHALAHTLRSIREAGKTPVVVSPPPRTGWDIGRCLSRAFTLKEPLNRCDFPRATAQSAYTQVYQLLASVPTEATLLSLDDILCDTICVTHSGSTLFYRDAGHLTLLGSQRVGQHERFRQLLP